MATKEQLMSGTVLFPDASGYADDVLCGVTEIAQYLDQSERQTHYQLEQGRLPAFQVGRLWRMRKSTHQDFVRRLEEQAIARATRDIEAT